MTDKNSIINALKRLERAGQEHSKANEKLRQAADEVAQKIISTTPDPINAPFLPMRYFIRDGDTLCFPTPGNQLQPVHGPEAGLTAMHRFAQDLANGLLSHIAELRESDAAAANSIATLIKKHAGT